VRGGGVFTLLGEGFNDVAVYRSSNLLSLGLQTVLLHPHDSQNLAFSKLAKILPLLEKLKTNCQQFGVFHKNLSMDESVVAYRGLHSAKQFMKGKPVKFEYIMWMLCSVERFP